MSCRLAAEHCASWRDVVLQDMRSSINTSALAEDLAAVQQLEQVAQQQLEQEEALQALLVCRCELPFCSIHFLQSDSLQAEVLLQSL